MDSMVVLAWSLENKELFRIGRVDSPRGQVFCMFFFKYIFSIFVVVVVFSHFYQFLFIKTKSFLK